MCQNYFFVSSRIYEINVVRENLRASKKEYNKTEDDLKSLQSVGQIIGEVLRSLDQERSNLLSFYKLLLIVTINFQTFNKSF